MEATRAAPADDAVLRDAIFALQGIDGKHLHWDTAGGGRSWHQQRFQVALPADWPADTSSKLGHGAVDALGLMGEAGWLYRRITHYIDTIQASPTAGPLQRALAAALQAELQTYREFLVDLEAQSRTAHLRHLCVAVQAPLRQLQRLAALTDGLTPHLAGGPLLRALDAHSRHGDRAQVALLQSLLTQTSRPWWEMLTTWVTRGLVPPDFWVTQRTGVPDRALWKDRFHRDRNQCPPPHLVPPHLLEQAWQAGKGLNFVRHCLVDGDYSWGPLEAEARASLASSPGGRNRGQAAVGDCLTRMAEAVNRHMLQSLREQHHVRLHLFCLKQFLLLGQGDFVTNLAQALHGEFAHQTGVVGIYRHTLAALTEQALRASNASFLPEDCLQRLQVELCLPPDDAVTFKFGPDPESAKDSRTVWDIFRLSYTLPDPVLAIIEPELMDDYQALFAHLFSLRKVEYYLNYTWRQSAMLSHALQSTAQFSGIKVSTDPYYARAVVLLRRIAITRQAMTNFVVNIKSFLMLEVIEGGWKNLERRVDESDSLDELIEAHAEFVGSVCRQSLLRRSKDDEISGAVHDLLELCNQFSLYQRDLFGQALQLAEKAAAKRRFATVREKEGNWGFDEIENSQTEENTFFGLSDASKMQDLDFLSSYFHETVVSLLQALDRKLNGVPEQGLGELATPTPEDDSSQNQADAYILDEDLKLLRFLRAQLDQNQFYEKDM